MKAALVIALLLAGCRPLPPVPTLPVHASTEGAGEGATTALLVVGWAGTPLGGGGFGGALRVEHQYTDATTLGVELTGGVATNRMRDGDDNDNYFRQWLLGARAYGRSRIGGSRYADYTYGVGLAVMGSHALVAQLHGGGLFGYPNDAVEPQTQLALAMALPILSGASYGDAGRFKSSVPYELYFGFDVGAIVHPRDSNRVSLDLGGADALTDDDVIFGLSVADSFRAN